MNTIYQIAIPLCLILVSVIHPGYAQRNDHVQIMSLGRKVFNHLKMQEVDLLFKAHYIPQAEYNSLIKVLLPGKRSKVINYHYDSVRAFSINYFHYQIKEAVRHDVDFKNLTMDSITYRLVDNNLFMQAYKEKLLVFVIYCSDPKAKYSWTIAPFVSVNKEWYLFLGDFNWQTLY
jgi:hypothetical protein